MRPALLILVMLPVRQEQRGNGAGREISLFISTLGGTFQAVLISSMFSMCVRVMREPKSVLVPVLADEELGPLHVSATELGICPGCLCLPLFLLPTLLGPPMLALSSQSASCIR